jgi:hypothetical protein
MGARLKETGTRAIAVVTVVCAALSPAALAAVGGVSAAERDAPNHRPAKIVRTGTGTGTGGVGGVRAPAAGNARGFAGHAGGRGPLAQ